MSSTEWLGIFLLPQANQNVAAHHCGEAPAGGGMLYGAPVGARDCNFLPAWLLVDSVGPPGWMDKGRAPVSDATHVSVSLAPEVNFGWDFTVVMQNLPLALSLGPWSFPCSVASAAFISAVLPSWKKKYPADRSFLTCHFGDHQQIL